MAHPPPPPPHVLRRIRARLVEAVDRRGIAIAKLARRAGLSKGTVHNLLGGSVSDVHLGTICALAEVLEVELESLLHKLPDEEDPTA